MSLRPYQSDALKEIRAHYARGTKKVLLHMSTGSGKTVIFCEVLKGAHEKGKKALMVVRGRKLVAQASQRLDREGVPHGVLMAGHWRSAPQENIQICSVDTLFSRKLAPPADILVLDEAHQAASNSYLWLADQYPSAFFLPVTATPYAKEGMQHIASVVVKPISMQRLIDQGYLVPPLYYAPADPDLTGVRTSNGDYNVEDLEKAMMLIGDPVSTWRRLAEDRPTIAFAVTVQHSKWIAQAFTADGVIAEHVDASSTDQEREQAIKRLENGTTKVLCNVGILCTGVDIPAASCILMARPTKSYMLYIQQAGRGTRTAPGKKDFIILDHAANVLRHGLITDEREACLEPFKIKFKQPVMTRCLNCFAVYSGRRAICPSCDVAIPGSATPKRATAFKDGQLEKFDPEAFLFLTEFARFKAIAKERGYKRGWVWHQLKEKFGEEKTNSHMPKRHVPDFVLAKLNDLIRS